MLYECLCFNLFVVCQNEDLKHVAGTVTRKREEKKTLLMYLCDQRFGEGARVEGGYRQQRRTEGSEASRL